MDEKEIKQIICDNVFVSTQDGRRIRVGGAIAAARIIIERLREVQLCGHERRFIVTGDDGDIDRYGEGHKGTTQWCALCQLDVLQEEIAGLRHEINAMANAAADTLRELTGGHR